MNDILTLKHMVGFCLIELAMFGLIYSLLRGSGATYLEAYREATVDWFILNFILIGGILLAYGVLWSFS